MLEGEASTTTPYQHRVMAGGMAELVFHYNGIFDELKDNVPSRKSFTAGLDAQSQNFKRFAIRQNFEMFGIQLYPYTISHLFAIPATAVKDQLIDLRDLLGENENGLEEQIMLANGFSERIAIFSHFLLSRLKKAPQIPTGIFETINHIIKTNGNTDVDALAQRNFLSMRQFERNFKLFTGFSPKLFSKIIRFQNTINQNIPSGTSLTEIALDAGYADQSHFIRDFKSFAGITPKEYFHKSPQYLS